MTITARYVPIKGQDLNQATFILDGLDAAQLGNINLLRIKTNNTKTRGLSPFIDAILQTKLPGDRGPSYSQVDLVKIPDPKNTEHYAVGIIVHRTRDTWQNNPAELTGFTNVFIPAAWDRTAGILDKTNIQSAWRRGDLKLRATEAFTDSEAPQIDHILFVATEREINPAVQQDAGRYVYQGSKLNDSGRTVFVTPEGSCVTCTLGWETATKPALIRIYNNALEENGMSPDVVALVKPVDDSDIGFEPNNT